ncbi:MAG: NAD(P)-binding protein, partial [Deltaproteobacteria bacterium]
MVGAGVGGLTATALLAKRGLKVLLIEQHYIPGGCTTAIRRKGINFDVGSELLYGWGERGYNIHRFVMNELEEEIDMIPHEFVYRMFILGKELTFWRDFDRFFSELANLFPNQKNELRAMFEEFYQIFNSIIKEDMMPMPPTEVPMKESLKTFLENPLGMLKIGLLMFKNSKQLVGKYITDPQVINFLDIITATFTSCDLAETPAVLSATMFVDNHKGGACYASGSPQMLPNKLERSIERYGGQILYRHLVDEILISKGKAYGVRLAEGTEIMADRVVSNATVWNLYRKLVKPEHIRPRRMKWAQDFDPT